MAGEKGKGNTSSRSRNASKRDLPQAEEPPKADLAKEMEFQRHTQLMQDKHDKHIAQIREHHSKEMNSVMMGLAAERISKPSLWARLTGRYKDIFVIFNHNLPVWCSKKDCPTRREGINFGIEGVTTSLHQAMEYVREYFEKVGDHPYAHAKILHLQVDRRKGRGSVVDEMSWTWPIWRNSNQFDDERKISAKMVDKMIKQP